jgi:diguanylate cyclase (GGDEF)-like protein
MDNRQSPPLPAAFPSTRTSSNDAPRARRFARRAGGPRMRGPSLVERCRRVGFAVLVAIAGSAAHADSAPSAGTTATAWERWHAVAFEHVTVRQGLPHPTTTAFAIDRDGLLWIGTFGGLVRYDGYRSQVFRQSPVPHQGPPDNYIRALQAAPDGSLIIGTSSGGLARFDPRTNRFEEYDASPDHGTGDRVMALAPDREGGFWIVGQRGEVNHLAADLRTISRLPADVGLPTDNTTNVFTVFEDSRSNLWIGSNRGLHRRRNGAERFERVLAADPAAGRVLGDDIWALHEDRAGNLWAGSGSSGVVVIDPQGAARVPPGLAGGEPGIGHRTVRSIVEAADGRLFIATDGIGISVYDPADATLARLEHDRERPDSLAGNIVRALLPDQSSGLWAATEAGASHCDLRPSIVHTLGGPAIFHEGADSGYENVRSVLTDRRGIVWLGFGRGRVAAVDPASGIIRTAKLHGAQEDQDVRALDELGDGRIVVGSRGLVTIDPQTMAVQPRPAADLDERPILAVKAYRGGLLVGTYDGLFRVGPDGRTERFEHVDGDARSLADNQVRNIVAMSDGSAWIATVGGISILRPGRPGFDTLVSVRGDPASLPQNYIGSIVETGARVWVGTYGGLASTSLAPGAGGYRFHTVRGGDHLGSRNIAAVLADREGRIWTATADGMLIYDPRNDSVRTMGMRDGLDARFYNHRTAALGPRGELLFGGQNGLTVIDPEPSVRPRRADAPLAITAASVDGERLPFGALPTARRPLAISADNRSLDVAFALLDYTAGASIGYGYRLEGFDDEWKAIEVGQMPAATYTNLAGGSYRLLLRATIPGLHERTIETSIPVTVAPHWYERRWVPLLFALALAAGVFLLVRARTHYLQHRAAQLSRLVTARTDELEAANRRLAHLANTDELTGLLNRRAVMRELDHECERAAALQRPLSILMLDMDGFKALNDRHGHLAGDDSLRAVAGIVGHLRRAVDHVGRYGGEELLMILPGVERPEALAIAERLRAAIAANTVTFGGAPLRVTASIGIATLRDGEPVRTLIARADAALYRAKREGRNTVRADAA